jgi:hypothetical protein
MCVCLCCFLHILWQLRHLWHTSHSIRFASNIVSIKFSMENLLVQAKMFQQSIDAGLPQDTNYINYISASDVYSFPSLSVASALGQGSRYPLQILSVPVLPGRIATRSYVHMWFIYIFMCKTIHIYIYAYSCLYLFAFIYTFYIYIQSYNVIKILSIYVCLCSPHGNSQWSTSWYLIRTTPHFIGICSMCRWNKYTT